MKIGIVGYAHKLQGPSTPRWRSSLGMTQKD